MSDEPRIDPEVLALLREVAEDPAARYFEGLRARGPVFTDRLRATSVATVDLTKAERQLLAVHREELAWILLMAAKRENATCPEGRDRFHRWVSVNERADLSSEEELSERALAWLGRSLPPEDGLDDAISLVRVYLAKRCVDRAGERLARAALEVCPSDAARMHLALALILSGEVAVGLTMLNDILRHRPQDQVAANVWENVALAEGLLGQPSKAQRAYRRACQMSSFPPGAAMAWLTWSCIEGSQSEALEAASIVDSWSVNMAAEFVDLIESQKRRGDWSPTKEAARVADAVVGRVGPPSVSILSSMLIE